MADKSKKSYYVAMYGIMTATIFVAMFIDKAVSAFLPLSMAVVVLLATFSFCLIQNDWIMGFAAGAIFGLASWVKALVFGEVYPMNPLVSFLPRLFVGISCFAVYRLMLLLVKKLQSLSKNKTDTKKSVWVRQTVAMAVGILVGLIVNTVLFLTASNLYKDFLGEEYSSLLAIIKVALFTNIIPEYLASILLVPPIVLGVRRGLKLGLEAKPFKQAEEMIITEPDSPKDLKPDTFNG